MSYTVVYGNNLSELISEVDKLLLKGWKPLGGVSARDGGLPGFVQAMVIRHV